MGIYPFKEPDISSLYGNSVSLTFTVLRPQRNLVNQIISPKRLLYILHTAAVFNKLRRAQDCPLQTEWIRIVHYFTFKRIML